MITIAVIGLGCNELIEDGYESERDREGAFWVNKSSRLVADWMALCCGE